MTINILLLLLGFMLLIKGADVLINGSISFAYKFGISKMVIGLTIVAIGTSLPELAVSVFSSVDGKSDLLFGNIVGSNIANILLILGVSAIFSPLIFKNKTVKKEIPILIFTSFLLIALIALFNADHVLNLWRGLPLLAFFVAFVYYVMKINHFPIDTAEEYLDKMSKKKSVLLIILGLIGLIVGARFIVSGGTGLAVTFGISEAVIGLIVIAIGTSLPELATSVIASRKHDHEIVIGNIIGSNIINILLILGISSMIHPIAVSKNLLFDLYLYAFITIMLFVLLIFNKYKISRYYGVTFIVIYIIYVIVNI